MCKTPSLEPFAEQNTQKLPFWRCNPADIIKIVPILKCSLLDKNIFNKYTKHIYKNRDTNVQRPITNTVYVDPLP